MESETHIAFRIRNHRWLVFLVHIVLFIHGAVLYIHVPPFTDIMKTRISGKHIRLLETTEIVAMGIISVIRMFRESYRILQRGNLLLLPSVRKSQWLKPCPSGSQFLLVKTWRSPTQPSNWYWDLACWDIHRNIRNWSKSISFPSY